MDQNDCVFCKIVSGELPSSKVYEDDNILAFLDIHPVNIGHTVIIPKKHFLNLYDTPDEILCEMMKITKKLSVAIKNSTKADGINLAMNNEPDAGQIVPHTHWHIIPRIKGDGYTYWHGKRDYNEGEMSEVSEKIKKEIK